MIDFGGRRKSAGKKNIGNKTKLIEKAAEGILKAQTEKKLHEERNFDTVDIMEGALSRRKELLTTMEYNFGLIKKSLETGETVLWDLGTK
jgi:hypothetical protein